MLEAGCIDLYLVPDDHGDSEGDATAIRVGADVRGALDYDDDIDFFRFQAEAGRSYQIDVALGTLDDSIVGLYDADGSFLDANDDYGDPFASRLYWEAPSSGERYVAVWGYGTGTYTLTVSIVDDRGDTAEDGGSVASDRAALIALYNATEGGSWTTRTNWLSGRPLDEWHGVTTDGGGRVTALDLYENGLTGEIPPELGGLSNLTTLVLYDNQLTGAIPPELGGLSNLTGLVLYSNQLTGAIPPELGGLSNLTQLYLGSNRLTGEIPPELGDLSNLWDLYLGSNRLTGEIPPELGDLSNLTGLALHFNQLTGEIPPELGGLSNLTELWLYDNGLTGEIPPELGGLSNLAELWLWNNQLTGEIPPELGGLSNLTRLLLNNNQLTGAIPPELGGLSNLTTLELGANRLTGCIPEGLRDIADNDLGNLNLPDCGLEGRPTASSFDVYLTLCASTEEELADDATFGDYSSLIRAEADRLEALTPPAQLSEWHLLNIEGFRTIQAFVDLQPKDDVIDIVRFFLMAAISAELEGKLGEVAARLPEDVLQQMVEAGCINPAVVPYDYVNDFESATRIAIGEAVAIEFEDPDDKELFVFLVEPGAEYVFTLHWESWNRWSYPSRPIMALFDAGGQELARLEDSNFSSNSNRSNKMMWQAVTGGDYYIGVGDGATFGSFTLTVTEEGAAEPFVSVSAGGRHTCGVRSNGSVACWGSNADGRATPPAGSFVSVSAGYNHTCGLRSDGSVACWGDDFAGEATPPTGSFLSVSAGWLFTCGVRSNGSVGCWGRNESGEATPPAGSSLSVSAGEGHTCGLRSDGSAACWGGNWDGQATPPAGSFLSVSAGEGHTCGVRSNGSVACWGDNYDGEATPPAGSFASVSAGFAHTCGVRSDGSVACWGWNGNGQATPPEWP